jgi:hypothetical protein
MATRIIVSGIFGMIVGGLITSDPGYALFLAVCWFVSVLLAELAAITSRKEDE